MKKKINIALILVVLTVWGFVASKTLKQYFFLEKRTIKAELFNTKLNINKIKKDTFTISYITRDPFLNKKNKVYVVSPSKNLSFKNRFIKKDVKPVMIKQKEVVFWPQISYHGYINSKDRNGELLILIKIDQKIHKLKLNEQSEGVTVKKVYKDSIELDFNKEKKTFRLY